MTIASGNNRTLPYLLRRPENGFMNRLSVFCNSLILISSDRAVLFPSQELVWDQEMQPPTRGAEVDNTWRPFLLGPWENGISEVMASVVHLSSTAIVTHFFTGQTQSEFLRIPEKEPCSQFEFPGVSTLPIAGVPSLNSMPASHRQCFCRRFTS